MARVAVQKRPVRAWRQQLDGFVAGLTRPSVPAFLAMCVAFAATALLLLWQFSEQGIAGAPGAHIARSAIDSEAFVTREALQLALSPAAPSPAAPSPAATPRLVVLGTSSTAQMLGDGSGLARQLKLTTGSDWRVHVLATPLQSPIDQVTLAETALRSAGEARVPTLIAIGFQVQRMGWSAERLADRRYRDRLGLRSAWADAELRDAGLTPRPRTGIHALDIHPFLVEKGMVALGRLALQRPALARVDYFDELDPADPAGGRQAAIRAQIYSGVANADSYLALLARLAARIEAIPSARLVFFEETMRPGYAAEIGAAEVAAQQQARFDRFVAGVGLPYWRLADEAGLSATDFHDPLHVRRGLPQAALQSALAQQVAALQGRP